MTEDELARLREADQFEDHADALAATGWLQHAVIAMRAANKARRSVLGKIADPNELRAKARTILERSK